MITDSVVKTLLDKGLPIPAKLSEDPMTILAYARAGSSVQVQVLKRQPQPKALNKRDMEQLIDTCLSMAVPGETFTFKLHTFGRVSLPNDEFPEAAPINLTLEKLPKLPEVKAAFLIITHKYEVPATL